MTLYQLNQFSMFVSMQNYLLSQSNSLTDLPDFHNFITELEEDISLIKAFKFSLLDQTWEKSKKHQKQVLIEAVLEIYKRIYTFAINTNNQLLIKEINYNEFDMKSMSDDHLIKYIQTILNNGILYLEELFPYGLSIEALCHIQVNITTYFCNSTNGLIVNTTESEVLLEEAIKHATEVLLKIDNLVEAWETKEPYFFNAYYKTRSVLSSFITS